MLEKRQTEPNFQKALKMGALCIVTYTASYIMRNILSVSSVQMLNDGFTKDKIGSISSVYFMAYALGQLVNGRLGDRIKTKKIWLLRGYLCRDLPPYSFCLHRIYICKPLFLR
ncbi:MAG: hypothetical protein L6V93_20910 [Clostridiales bacterium]|nr:MAG: hypothetical protein L6V93_20910 [Clostridiales bacterium]